jgi:metallo-beta-lactamase family protein
LLFGGDLGRYGRPVLPDPLPIDHADILLVESTYGNRVHEPDDNGERLAAIVNRAVTRGGKLIIPAFAIGRVEEVIYWLRRLEEEKRIPVLPVYVDSPMAAAALEFYKQRMHELDPDLNKNVRDVCAFCTARMTVVETADQSRAVTASDATLLDALRGWPREAVCCTTWLRHCRTAGTPCSLSVTRPPARAAARCATVSARSRCWASWSP